MLQKIKSLSPLVWTLFMGFGLLAILLILTPHRAEIPLSRLPWNAEVSKEPKTVKVLDINIPNSSLKDVISIYGEDFELSLFSNKDESNKSLEAYFPVFYLGNIKAGLLLKLSTDKKKLNEYYDNGIETTITIEGQRKVKLLGTDVVNVLEHTIDSITLIPKKKLSHKSIKNRFGNPKKIIKDHNSKIERWRYPQLGLEIIYDPDGPEALQYSRVFID